MAIPLNHRVLGRQTERVVTEDQVRALGLVGRMDPARVRAQMSTREGEPYTDESVERDLRTLYATGAVENVDIQAVNVAGGVKVIVTISGRGVRPPVRGSAGRTVRVTSWP